jgi:hypothetical protein
MQQDIYHSYNGIRTVPWFSSLFSIFYHQLPKFVYVPKHLMCCVTMWIKQQAWNESAYKFQVVTNVICAEQLEQSLNIKYITTTLVHTKSIMLYIDWLVFSPWASFGRNQSPVKQPVWLWHAAF